MDRMGDFILFLAIVAAVGVCVGLGALLALPFIILGMWSIAVSIIAGGFVCGVVVGFFLAHSA